MPNSTYSDIVRGKMQSFDNPTGRPVSLRQLAAMAGCSYEHVRKVLQGAPFASRRISDAICKALGLDPDRLWSLMVRAKLSYKFGGAVAQLPHDTRLADAWDKLNDTDRERLINVAQGFVLASEAEKALHLRRRATKRSGVDSSKWIVHPFDYGDLE